MLLPHVCQKCYVPMSPPRHRIPALQDALSEVRSGAIVEMCTAHGDNPLFRAIRHRDLQLVSLIAQQCHAIALNCEV
jgi:hypothetical protein